VIEQRLVDFIYRAFTLNSMLVIAIVGGRVSVFYGAKYRNQQKNYTMFVVRIKVKDGGKIELAESKPCNICVNMMKKIGVKKVYYSTSKGTITCQKLCEIELYQSHGLQLYLKNNPTISIVRFLSVT
jgi:hypothetical protein